MIFLVSGSTPSWRKSLGYGKESLLVPIRTQFQNTKGIVTTLNRMTMLILMILTSNLYMDVNMNMNMRTHIEIYLNINLKVQIRM